MKLDKETLIIGGIAIAAVIAAIVFAGRSNSSGIAFSAPDPNSVAAVENGIGAQIQANNAAGVQRAQDAMQTIVSLASLQQGLLLGQVNANDSLAATQAEVAGQTQQAELQTSASIANTEAAASASQQIAQYQSQAAIKAANAQANAEANAANAQATSSFWSGLFGSISSAIPFFSAASNTAGFGAALPSSNGENVYTLAPAAVPIVQYAGAA